MSKRSRKDRRDLRRGSNADEEFPKGPDILPHSNRRSRRHRIALCILGPLLLLGLLEVILRISGYGYPVSFFIRSGSGFIPNDSFGRRYHCREMPDPFFLPEVKPVGSVRIFVLGESAAHGTPDSAFGVSRILEAMLRDQFPGKQIDVFNCAMMGINSHSMAPIARACVQQNADLLIVYAGNNELIGSYGASTGWAEMPSPLSRILIDAALWARSTKTGQWLDDFVGARISKWRTMEIQNEDFFQSHRLRADSPARDVVREHFSADLEEICDAARGTATKVLFSTVSVNLKDCAPFGSLHPDAFGANQSNEWEAAYQRGIAAESASQPDAALEAYRRTAAIDGQFADLRYRMGRCLASRGDFAKARDEFVKAVDCDAIPFRCDSRLNDVVRDVAARRGIPLVDAERTMAAADAAEHGIPGDALFLDHVHFNFHGNYELASALFPAVAPKVVGALGATLQTGRPLLGEKDSAERLAFTPWDEIKVLRPIAKLIAAPPFQGQMDFTQRLANLRIRIQSLETSFKRNGPMSAMQTYVSAMERAPDDWYLHRNLGELMNETGHHDTAIVQAEWVVNRFPQHLPFQLLLACSRIDGGDFPGASRDLEIILRRDPMNAVAQTLLGIASQRSASVPAREATGARHDADQHCTLGNSLLAKGQVAEAIAEYRQAAAIAPDWSVPLNNLGSALFRADQTDEAIASLEKAVRLRPDYGNAHMNLGIALSSQRNYADAIAHLTRATELRATSPAASAKLALLLAAAPDDALRNGTNAVRLAEDACERTGRKLPLALDALAAAYAETGRYEDAVRVATESQALGNRQAGDLIAHLQAHRPVRLPPKDAAAPNR